MCWPPRCCGGSRTRREWQRAPMTLASNDRWHGQFTPPEPGSYIFELEAWTDQFATWRKEFLLKQAAGQNVWLEAREGLELLTQLMPADDAARSVVEAAAQKFQSDNDPARPARQKTGRGDERKRRASRSQPQHSGAADRRPRTRARRRLV